MVNGKIRIHEPLFTIHDSLFTKNMEAVAKTKYLKGSPRKARLVIDLIRGVNVSRALSILRFTNKRAADPIAKCLSSAIANATYLAEQQNIAIDPDGLWINHGSLAFADGAPGDAFSLEELLDALPAAGFARTEAREAQLPYLSSPASRHARLETVITFATRKERDIEAPAPGRAVPDWLRQGDLAVPALPQFRAQALSTRVYAFLLAMIDGERTIRDMARLMEQQKLMTAADAEPAIRRFLMRALEQADQRPGF